MLRGALVFGTALTLAACSSTFQPTATIPASQAPQTRVSQALRATGTFNYLYVTDPNVNQLEVLDPNYNLVQTYTNGLAKPIGDFVDGNGNLYVANENNCVKGNVVEYAHGATSPTFTYSAGLSCPDSVGADKKGNVYVFDGGGGGTTLYKFKQKKNKVVTSWNTCNTTLYKSCSPEGLAMGTNGWVYLTIWGLLPGGKPSGYWVVDEVVPKLNQQGYVPGSFGPAGGTAIDKKKNLLAGAYPVGGCGKSPLTGNETIVDLPYPYHGTDWCPFDLGYVGFTAVTGLALSADQSLLYVADYGGATVTVLSYPTGSYVTSLGSANGLTDPEGVAIGPAP